MGRASEMFAASRRLARLPITQYPYRVGAAQVIARSYQTRGKSELHRAECQLTAGGGNPEESATESIPPGRVRFGRMPRGKGETAR